MYEDNCLSEMLHLLDMARISAEHISLHHLACQPSERTTRDEYAPSYSDEYLSWSLQSSFCSNLGRIAIKDRAERSF
jgi:hypothetical protein